MPGLVIGSRRWAIGSDDFIIPGSILVILHFSWLTTFTIDAIADGSVFPVSKCSPQLVYHNFGSFIMILGEIIVELCIIRISLRGTILNPLPRKPIKPLLIIRIVFFLLDICWESYGTVILLRTPNCDEIYREFVIFLRILNGLAVFIFGFSMWCSYDPAGRSWVKMKRFQESLRNPKFHYKRSQSQHRNWRYREAMREYEQSWQNRCRNFFCLLTFKSPRDNSFGDIAKLLSEFFRGLDVVPSDVIAGLSLMRAKQKVHFKEQLKAKPEVDSKLPSPTLSAGSPAGPSSPTTSSPKIFEFLSGMPITAKTDFLDLMHPLVIQEVQNLIHYFHYSLAIYGWPMYLVNNSPRKWCKLCQFFTCFCCFSGSGGCCLSSCCGSSRAAGLSFEDHFEADTIVDRAGDIENPEDLFVGDNCCHCNRAAIQETCIEHNYKIIYMNYEVEVEKPPFFVAVDFEKMSIVISIRGTLSLYDILTDLNAEYDHLPVTPPNEEFYGHKGMIAAASHILTKLLEKQVIKRAAKELKAQDRGCGSYQNQCAIQYPIIVVGHSLGAGTAAILTILLRQTYSNVMCFAFAPPGGLLSAKAAEYSRDFVVSVVHGKDCVPRLGLHQMEKMRFDLIMAIKQCNLPKWSIITRSCCWLRNEKNISLESFIEKFRMDHQDDDDDDENDDEDNGDDGEDDDEEEAAHPRDSNTPRAINSGVESIRRIASTSSSTAGYGTSKSIKSIRSKRENSKSPRKSPSKASDTRRRPGSGSMKEGRRPSKAGSRVGASGRPPAVQQSLSVHPNDDSISLTVHAPLYPPGSIIHLVRSHPASGSKHRSKWRNFVDTPETIVQAIWSNFKDYNEIIISPTMVRDHMPDQMLKAMQNLLESTNRLSRAQWSELNSVPDKNNSGRSSTTQSSSTPSRCQHVETSFAQAFDPTANELEQRFTNLNEDRLRRLRSLVRKGRAPLAEDESWSLEDGVSTEPEMPTDNANAMNGFDVRSDEEVIGQGSKSDDLKPGEEGEVSQQSVQTSIIIDLTTNGL